MPALDLPLLPLLVQELAEVKNAPEHVWFPKCHWRFDLRQRLPRQPGGLAAKEARQIVSYFLTSQMIHNQHAANITRGEATPPTDNPADPAVKVRCRNA